MSLIIAKQIIFLILSVSPLFYLVYRVRDRKIKDLLFFIGLIFLYVLVQRRFISTAQVLYHDTMWTYQVFYSIINQWLQNGFQIGWNPYMNGGEPLFIYSNYYMWAEFVIISLLNKLFGAPINMLVNLYFIYIFISYFVFCFILFSVVFKKSPVIFFSAAILIFSGITYGNMGQPMLLPLYLLPLVFISLYYLLVKQKIVYLFWVFFFVCVSINHYLPHYLLMFIIIFGLSWCLINIAAGKRLPIVFQSIFKIKGMLKAYKNRIIFILILSFFAAMPAFYVYTQINEYVSPTRGGGGNLNEVKNINATLQPAVNHSFDKYVYLIGMPKSDLSNHSSSNLRYQHSIYYVGIIPLLFFFLSFMKIKEMASSRYFYLTCVLSITILVFMALGDEFWLWALMKKYIPIFFVRHSFPISNIICLLIILISTYGFFTFIRANEIRYIIIFLICLMSIITIARVAEYENTESFDLKPFLYPKERSLYSEKLMDIPFDTTPLILKKASASHPSEDFVFFRNKQYDKILKEDPGFVTGSLFLFTKDLKTAENIYEIPVDYIIENNPNDLRVKVDVKEDGYLIRKENFNKNWKAMINNVNVPILKYKDVFQAVKVSKGNSIIDFIFSSPYPIFFWLHILAVLLGYLVFFKSVIVENSS